MAWCRESPGAAGGRCEGSRVQHVDVKQERVQRVGGREGFVSTERVRQSLGAWGVCSTGLRSWPSIW